MEKTHSIADPEAKPAGLHLHHGTPSVFGSSIRFNNKPQWKSQNPDPPNTPARWAMLNTPVVFIPAESAGGINPEIMKSASDHPNRTSLGRWQQAQVGADNWLQDSAPISPTKPQQKTTPPGGDKLVFIAAAV
ncbi:hypothetical protein ACLOJK_019534 [Asimina triloba]